jgi:hypothetical protein
VGEGIADRTRQLAEAILEIDGAERIPARDGRLRQPVHVLAPAFESAPFARCYHGRNSAFTATLYSSDMSRYAVVRLWLADRPGSLGQIATKIGEVGGDLVGIDILERDGARAVDELTVELAPGYEPDELVAVLSQLAGVEVEDLRHLVSREPYASRDPLDVAVALAEATDPVRLSAALAQGICTAFSCEWSIVLGTGEDGAPSAVATLGNPPSPSWLGAFVAGARTGLSLSSGDAGLVGPRDVAWAPLEVSGLVVVAGRDGPPFRGRERRQLQQLCRVADARWVEITGSDPRLATL